MSRYEQILCRHEEPYRPLAHRVGGKSSSGSKPDNHPQHQHKAANTVAEGEASYKVYWDFVFPCYVACFGYAHAHTLRMLIHPATPHHQHQPQNPAARGQRWSDGSGDKKRGRGCSAPHTCHTHTQARAHPNSPLLSSPPRLNPASIPALLPLLTPLPPSPASPTTAAHWRGGTL